MSYRFYNAFAFIVVTILLLIMAFSCKTASPKSTIIEARYKIPEYSNRFFWFEDMWFPLDTSKAGAIWILKSDSIYLKISNGVTIDTLSAWPLKINE